MSERRRKPKIDHSRGMDHSTLLDMLLSEPEKYGIPPYFNHWKEKFVEKKDGLSAEPDLVFFHEDGSITIVEVKTSPYHQTEGDVRVQLRRGRKFFESLGLDEICLKWAYMEHGKPKCETPAEFILYKLEEQRK